MDGLLVVDKPGGMTSHDVVARVRRCSGERSIGHLGTLDPMATGVLPLLLGRYTRLAQFFGRLDKSYTGSIRFGFATDTYDAEGEQAGQRSELLPDSLALRAAVAGFSGVVQQTPPAYSAKKISGTAAYALARKGKPVELASVPVTVSDFAVEALHGDTAEFHVRLSAGGYVRSLAHDLGQTLGCGAHLASLRRVAAGPFTLADAYALNQIEGLAAAGELAQIMPHPRSLLPELPNATADIQAATRLRNGGAANLAEFSNAPLVKIFAGRHELIGIGRRVAGTLFQPVVVLA